MLGGTVTIAHTAGVFALGFVTLGLSAFIVPEQLYPWLTLVSGLLVVLVGASVLRQRLRARRHVHHHDHGHGHGHFSLGLAATITAIGLVAVFARRTFLRLSFDGPLIRALPAASAALILAVGVIITARALPGVL